MRGKIPRTGSGPGVVAVEFKGNSPPAASCSNGLSVEGNPNIPDAVEKPNLAI